MNILRIGLTVIIVFAFTGCEGRKNKYWYYSVEVDLLVEGKSERLIGFYECRHRGPQFHTGEGPYTFSDGYHPAKRLKSNAAVVVVPQNFCNFRIPHPGEWIGFYDVKKYDGPRPQVYWLNDAGHPTRIESFESDIYYEIDDPRVQLERFKFGIVSDRRARRMNIPSPEHEAVMRSYGIENQRVWVAYYAIIAPRSLWSERAGLEEWLEEYNELSELRLKDPNDKNLKNLFDQFNELTNFAPGRVYVRGTEFNTAADDRYEASRRLVPLLRRETRLRLSPRLNQTRGLLIHVPRDELESCAPPPQECVTFCIDGRCHNMNGQSGLYFDPVTETIFRMGLIYGRIVGVR